MSEQDPSLEQLKDPKDEIERTAWDVIRAWDCHWVDGDGLDTMPETIDALRQALTDGDAMGLSDPSSPYYNPEQQ
jgi:aryl-alcohol dehydrogenase-like predicted oxidoreductase